MAFCNRAHIVHEADQWNAIGDPTEAALLVASRKLGITEEQINEQQLHKVSDFPFSSDRKLATSIREIAPKELRAFVIGAPDVVLELCSNMQSLTGVVTLSEDAKRTILKQNTQLADSALRVLAGALTISFFSDIMRTTTVSLSHYGLLMLLSCIPLVGVEILKLHRSRNSHS